MVDFSDLDDTNLDHYGQKPARKAKKDRPTFPCQSCVGTGQYQQVRVHQEKAHCFACGGRGFFYTDPHKRAANKVKRRARKVAEAEKQRQILIAAQAQFNKDYPGVIDMARDYGKTSEFMRSLVDQFGQKGALSEKQVEAVRKFAAKRDEFQAQRQAERDKLSTEVDLSPIHAMFDKARSSGLKKLQYRAEGLTIKPAPASGANAGALYVKTSSGTYLGKVTGNKFMPSRDATAHTSGALLTIAKNPVEAAKAYGKLTGSCSCCGRELTDPASIEAGIGPVCVTKWFGFAMPGPTKAEAKAALAEAAIEINTNYSKARTSSVAGKYDHLYKEGMTAAEKKALRAKIRKERK